MSFNPAPTALIPSWSEDGTNVTFPIASVPELTAAEADAATGDSRKVVYALMERFYQWYNGLSAADRPAKLTITKSSSNDEAASTKTVFFSVQATGPIGSFEVGAE